MRAPEVGGPISVLPDGRTASALFRYPMECAAGVLPAKAEADAAVLRLDLQCVADVVYRFGVDDMDAAVFPATVLVRRAHHDR